MTAIQKVREVLRGQLALLHSLANDTTEANWRDKRLYILQTCVRMSDALAALDAETPATPADVGELVERLREKANKLDDMQGFSAPSGKLEREAATALERVVRERDEALEDLGKVIMSCPPTPETRTSPAHIGVRVLRTRLESTEAKLAEARKVIEPFAEQSKRFDDAADQMGFARSFDEYKPATEFTHGHLRAARQFAEEVK